MSAFRKEATAIILAIVAIIQFAAPEAYQILGLLGVAIPGNYQEAITRAVNLLALILGGAWVRSQVFSKDTVSKIVTGKEPDRAEALAKAGEPPDQKAD